MSNPIPITWAQAAKTDIANDTAADYGGVDPTTFHESYHPLFEIELFLSKLTTSYPGLVSREVVGWSAQGREIFALKIANSTERDDEDERKEKGVLVLSGAQHAREVRNILLLPSYL